MIDIDQPGIEVRPLLTMTGAAEFAEVVFDDAVARAEDIVGEVDRGWAVAMRMLENERGPYAIRRVAVLVERASAGSTRWPASGTDPAHRHRVVDATIAMRLLELRAGRVASLLADGLTARGRVDADQGGAH